MADPDEPERLITPHERLAARLAAEAAAEAAAKAATQATKAPVRPVRTGLAFFAGTIVLCLLAYLVAAVPGAWFPRASTIGWGPGAATLTRGTGGIVGNTLVITGVDAAETALISINTDIRSADFRAVAWEVADVPPQADVRMLWRNDYAQSKMYSVPVTVISGRLVPVDVAANPNWIGRVNGIALLIQTPLAQPMRFRAVLAKPMGALAMLRDRLDEWIAFEGWTGVSINIVPGGANIQDLPLPPILALAALLAIVATLVRLRYSTRLGRWPLAIGAIFVAAWMIADARWQWTLVRQVAATGEQYAGKDWREKHLAAEDGPLFQFIEKVRAKLPETPARVFMIADANYFRSRGAYHLLPHAVYFDPYQDTLPKAGAYRPGDYLVVFNRRGIQYDAARGSVRFADGSTLNAEVVLTDRGAAVLRIL